MENLTLKPKNCAIFPFKPENFELQNLKKKIFQQF